MSTNQAPLPYWRLSGFYFFYFALLGATMPYWSLYLRHLGYSSRETGLLFAIMVLTKVVAPSLWGWLADRTSQRMRIIRFGCAAAMLVFLGIFFNDGFLWLCLIFAGYSFFWNAVLAQFEVVTLSHLVNQYQRYGRIRLWGSIGFIATVASGGLLFDQVAIDYLPYAQVVILALLWLSSLTVTERETRKSDKTVRDLWKLLRQPMVIAFFSICFLLQVSHGPYYTFFSLFLRNHDYSTVVIGNLWALGVIAEVFLFFYFHYLLQHFSLKSILMVSLLLTTARWVLMAFFVEQLPVIIFAQLLHAASFGALHALAIDVVRRLFAGGMEGQGQALYSATSFGAGTAVGAVTSGLIWDVSPVASFIISSVISLLACVIAWRFIGNLEQAGEITTARQA